MADAFFPSDAPEFFRALAANNSREQFAAMREIYDRAIRGPLELLTAAAQEKYGPGKVMRPNRDVRFSADKSPYRIDASMWAGSVGGVYLRLSTSGIEAAGACMSPLETNSLEAVRRSRTSRSRPLNSLRC